eukprot:2994644-Prorocentrum_lima.AAC.1
MRHSHKIAHRPLVIVKGDASRDPERTPGRCQRTLRKGQRACGKGAAFEATMGNHEGSIILREHVD